MSSKAEPFGRIRLSGWPGGSLDDGRKFGIRRGQKNVSVAAVLRRSVRRARAASFPYFYSYKYKNEMFCGFIEMKPV